jgi:hypothetical protein
VESNSKNYSQSKLNSDPTLIPELKKKTKKDRFIS